MKKTTKSKYRKFFEKISLVRRVNKYVFIIFKHFQIDQVVCEIL